MCGWEKTADYDMEDVCCPNCPSSILNIWIEDLKVKENKKDYKMPDIPE